MIKEVRTLERNAQNHINSYFRRKVLKKYFAVYKNKQFIGFVAEEDLSPYHYKGNIKLYNAYDLKEYKKYLKTAKRGRPRKKDGK
jgi:hypothetical protein